MDYPDAQAEKNILGLKMESIDSLQPILNIEKLNFMKESVDAIFVDEKIKDLIVKIVHATRPGSKYFNKKYTDIIQAGASPRASIWLYKIAKFKALMSGKDHVTPEHILSIVKPVLGHRVLLSYEAQIDKMDVKDIVFDIANENI